MRADDYAVAASMMGNWAQKSLETMRDRESPPPPGVVAFAAAEAAVAQVWATMALVEMLRPLAVAAEAMAHSPRWVTTDAEGRTVDWGPRT